MPRTPLKAPVSVDVAIVGAGISGAFMARDLSRDHSVVVLDRRPPLMGSTVASTALLQWEIDLPLVELSKRIGARNAARAWRRSFAAVQDLKAIVERERIVCGLKDKSSLYLAGDQYGHRLLEAETQARKAAGLESEYVGGNALRERYGLERTGAILAPDSATGDPARLAAGLLRRAASRGATIHSPVEVLDVLPDPDGVTLATDAGHAVRAEHVVFCSGYEFPRGVPTPGAKVISTWAMASMPRQRTPRWLRETLLWEASDPYLYLRMARDGRLIVGGEDEESATLHASKPTLIAKCRRLEKKLKALLPMVEFEVDYAWAGAFGESSTGLPQIGPVEGMMDRVHAVMGFGGNGITYSVIASQIVGAAIRGDADPDADLYRA